MFDWKSESIDQIADALCKAQKVMQPAIKDRSNPAFKSKYADLAGVWEAMGDALQANGLSLVQLPFPIRRPGPDDGELDDSGFILRTVLMHKSGQWIASDLPMFPEMKNPHKVGGALTYARRYGASAMCGVYQDDDDGNTAAHGGGHNRDHSGYQNGHGRQTAPPPREPEPSAPAVDNRTYAEFVAAAAEKCLCGAMTVHRHVIEKAVAAGMADDGLRDNDAMASDGSDLYRHRREWVRGVVKAFVASKSSQPSAA